MDPAHLPLSIERQEADAASMLRFTRTLLAVRKASPALRAGTAASLPTPANVLGFERTADGERVICLFEFGGVETSLGPELAGQPLLLSDGAAASTAGVRLPPYGFALVRA